MKKPTLFTRLSRSGGGVLAAALMVASGQAGTNVFNFNTDPSGILTIRRSSDGGVPPNLPGEWFQSGGSTLEAGVVNQSTNGYLAITQTTAPTDPHGMRATIVFDDFDNGLVVAGFTFSCDVRIGAGSSTPADGFSINFARDTDPAIYSDVFGAGPNNNPPSGQEEGTTTGLVISFDAFANSAADPVGLTIKVDNVVLTNVPMPNFNRACADPTSLQTGTNDVQAATNLCWQPLNVELKPSGLLSVSYKNVTLLTNFVTQYTPSPGRLIFAGRTGASYQEQDVDNIRIVTFASSAPVVGPTTANANGFRFNIIDSGFATPDTNTITLMLDGVTVPPTAITQSGSPGGGNGVTLVGYQNTSLLLAPGSTHTNVVRFTGSTFNGTVDVTNVFTVAAYTTLAAAQQAPGAVNTNLSGFVGRVHQLPVARPTSLNGIERQLADGFIDPNTGQPYVNTASVSTFTNEMINWNLDALFGGQAGLISILQPAPSDTSDEPVPGIDYSSPSGDFVAAEVLGILDLPAGAYQLGVNHDDGFKLSVGAEPRDVFGATVLATSAGSGDTSPINIVVTNAGKYPFRLVWGQNTGTAQLEFYLIDFATGHRILVNNTNYSTKILSYSDSAALTKPYVKWVSPGPGEGGDPRSVVVKLQDGSAGSVIPGSVSLKVNGAGSASVSKVGGETTAKLTSSTIPPGTNATATLVYSTTSGGPFTNTWNFVISYFGQVLLDVRLDEGSGTNLTDSVWGLTGSFTTNNVIWTNDTPTRASSDHAVYFTGGAGRKALIVDTNHVISLGPDNSGANGDYTLQAWVKLPVGFEPAARMVLYTYEGTPGFVFSINTGRTLHTTTYGLNDITSTAVVPNDGEWHHVAVAHVNGVGMNFYIDGVLSAQSGYNRGPGARTSFTVSVGGTVGNQNNIFTGTLDRIKVTKGALSEGELDYPIGVALSAVRVGNTVTLSWPTLGGNLIPQSANAVLPSGTVWTDVPGTPVVNGNTTSVQVTVGPGMKYFRLRPAP